MKRISSVLRKAATIPGAEVGFSGLSDVVGAESDGADSEGFWAWSGRAQATATNKEHTIRVSCFIMGAFGGHLAGAPA